MNAWSKDEATTRRGLFKSPHKFNPRGILCINGEEEELSSCGIYNNNNSKRELIF